MNDLESLLFKLQGEMQVAIRLAEMRGGILPQEVDAYKRIMDKTYDISGILLSLTGNKSLTE